MSVEDIVILLPVVIMAGGILFSLLLIAIKRHHKMTFAFTMVLLTASLIATFLAKPDTAYPIENLFLIDAFGYYYLALILLATMAVAVFSYLSLRDLYPEKRKEEYYSLLMIATLGAAMMAFSVHFISFFVSLEVLSVSLYGLIGYYRTHPKAIEASFKYLVLAAVSVSFLLLGMALVYAFAGAMDFASLAGITLNTEERSILLLVSGIALMIVGIGFKLAAVPFHIWTPDVYEGASSPISAFIATVSKGSIVALLLRFFIMADLYRFEHIVWVFTMMSVLSMLAGNLLALMQNNIKRILAYSSIAHFGYLLVAVIAGNKMGFSAATFYLTIYVITILTAFGLVTVFSRSQEEATDMLDYQGLFWRKPFFAFIFTLSLLSLAGIPLTAGFIGKFFVLTAGVGTAKWLLAFTLVLGSVIGLYYYLRIIVVMLKKDSNITSPAEFSPITSLLAGGVVLFILTALMIGIGVYPAWLLDWVNNLSI